MPPPLQLHIQTTTPSGKHHRWGCDERRPEDVYKSLSFSTAMPGGFEAMDTVLSRKTNLMYPDLEPLSTLRVRGMSGEIAWEGRLEHAPLTSGDDRTISAQAVGWQAHLEDDPTAREIPISRDLGEWRGASTERKLSLEGGNYATASEWSSEVSNNGIPTFSWNVTGPWDGGAVPIAESVYDAGPGLEIAKVFYNVDVVNAQWAALYITSVPVDTATTSDTTGNLAAGTGDAWFEPDPPERCITIQGYHSGAYTGSGNGGWKIYYLTVLGKHGLTLHDSGDGDPGGLYASDVVAHIVGRWAPLLNYSVGLNGTIQPTSFAIPHLSFRDHTTCAEMVKQTARFGLQDWAVWQGPSFSLTPEPTFYFTPRSSGRRWRARTGPAQLQETGPQIERTFNAVIVRFQDPDGSEMCVGPVGWDGCEYENNILLDLDPDNPVNLLGMRRPVVLEMGIVSTPAAATEVGRRFKEESRQLDQSGSAQITGHVQDDKGVLRPAWQIRAGDLISFVDAGDTSYRRIVKTQYEHDSRTCSVDLDAPPEGMSALLERLGVSIVGFGL